MGSIAVAVFVWQEASRYMNAMSAYPALNIISSGAVCARPYVLAAYVLVSYVPTAMCPPYVPKQTLGASSAAKILRGGDPTFA